MGFKDNLVRDMDIFLGLDDFGEKISHGDKDIQVIWRDKTEVVLEDQTTAVLPWAVMRRGDAEQIMNGDAVVYGGKTYRVVDKKIVDPQLAGVYLSVDDRVRF